MKRKRSKLPSGRDVWGIIYQHVSCLFQRSQLACVCQRLRDISYRDEVLQHIRSIRKRYQDDRTYTLTYMGKLILHYGVDALELCFKWFIRFLYGGDCFYQLAQKAMMFNDDRFLLHIQQHLTCSQCSVVVSCAKDISILEKAFNNAYGPVNHCDIFVAATRHGTYKVIEYYMEKYRNTIDQGNAIETALGIACIWGYTRIQRLLWNPNFDIHKYRTMAHDSGEIFFLDE